MKPKTSNFRTGEQPTIIILRALALGDFLTALPALRALKRVFPQHKHVLTCPRWLQPLVRLLGVADDFIDGAYFDTEDEEVKEYKVPTDLHTRIELEKAQLYGLDGVFKKPDLAINLRGVRVATQQVLLALKPRRLISFYNPYVPETEGSPIWQPDEHEVVRWCRLLQENNIPANPNELHFTPSDINIPDSIKGATIIHPGAGSPARHWPLQRWASVAQWEKQRGNKVVLTGGPNEVEIASKVATLADLPQDAILAGRTNILELVGICSMAKRILSSDTGIAHLAVALRIPSVTLFGPMPPSRWGPPSHLNRHRVLWSGTTGEPYASTPDSGLLRISVDDVITEIVTLEIKGH